MIHPDELLKKRILSYLLDHQNIWLTISSLAESLKIGYCSIQTQLAQLKELIEREGNGEINLIILKKRGVCLTNSGDNTSIIGILFEKIISESAIHQLIASYFYETIVNYTSYSMKHFMSVSSLRRKVKTLRDVLEPWEIKIKKNQFFGEEFAIRCFLIQYYLEVYQPESWPFEEVDKQAILHVISLLETKFGFKLNGNSKNKFCFFWAICRIRQKKLHYLREFQSEIALFARSNRLFPIFKRVCEESIPETVYRRNELYYLFYLFFSLHIDLASLTPQRIDELSSLYLELKDEGTLLAQDIVAEFMKLFPRKGLLINEDLLTYELFLVSRQAVIFYKKLSDVWEGEFTLNLIDDYPKIHERMVNIVTGSISNFSFKVNQKSLVEYLSLVLHNSRYLSRYGNKIRIAITSSEGIITNEMLSYSIRQHFRNAYNLEFVLNKEQVDIVITDIPNFQSRAVETIYFSHHKLTFQDLCMLDERFNLINKQKMAEYLDTLEK